MENYLFLSKGPFCEETYILVNYDKMKTQFQMLSVLLHLQWKARTKDIKITIFIS